MAMLRPEKAYEKNAWILLLLAVLVAVALAGVDSITISASSVSSSQLGGISWDANSAQARVVAEFLRTTGQWMFFSSIIFVAIAMVPYKKGEKWAWYVMWTLPANFVIGAARDLSLGYTGFFPLWYPFILVPIIIAIVGLVLPYRKFFPKVSATGGS